VFAEVAGAAGVAAVVAGAVVVAVSSEDDRLAAADRVAVLTLAVACEDRPAAAVAAVVRVGVPPRAR
jgi:hypothetical protein